VNVKQNMNEYIGHKSLTLNDVETPMMENFKHTCIQNINMEWRLNKMIDVITNACVKNRM